LTNNEAEVFTNERFDVAQHELRGEFVCDLLVELGDQLGVTLTLLPQQVELLLLVTETKHTDWL